MEYYYYAERTPESVRNMLLKLQNDIEHYQITNQWPESEDKIIIEEEKTYEDEIENEFDKFVNAIINKQIKEEEKMINCIENQLITQKEDIEKELWQEHIDFSKIKVNKTKKK